MYGNIIFFDNKKNDIEMIVDLDAYRNKDQSMYLLYIEAVSVSNNKEVNEIGKENDNSEFTIKVTFIESRISLTVCSLVVE